MHNFHKRDREVPDFVSVYKDFVEVSNVPTPRIERPSRSGSTWSFDHQNQEKTSDEEHGSASDMRKERGRDYFQGSASSTEPGSLLSLSDRLSLTSLNRRSSFNKSNNTLVNRLVI